jgi:hypothetical protein
VHNWFIPCSKEAKNVFKSGLLQYYAFETRCVAKHICCILYLFFNPLNLCTSAYTSLRGLTLYFCPKDSQKLSGWHDWVLSAWQDLHHGIKSVLLLEWSNHLLKAALWSWWSWNNLLSCLTSFIQFACL